MLSTISNNKIQKYLRFRSKRRLLNKSINLNLAIKNTTLNQSNISDLLNTKFKLNVWYVLFTLIITYYIFTMLIPSTSINVNLALIRVLFSLIFSNVSFLMPLLEGLTVNGVFKIL